MSFLSILISILFSFILSGEGIEKQQDLNALYQPTEQINQQKSELQFWQERLAAKQNENAYKSKLAGAHSKMFGLTADIEHLKQAEKLLLEISASQPINRSSVLRALARNYISQHRFCEALDAALEADLEGEDKRANMLVLSDIYGELGEWEEQASRLNKLSNKEDFDYFIRLAKWEDQQGNLDFAIAYLERAEDIASSSKQGAQINWIRTNLADFYGHAGDIDKSKSYFNKALQGDPGNWYAMKGLAWIAYSGEGNADKALEILGHLKGNCKSPDVEMLEAEILEYTEEVKEAAELITKVKDVVEGPAYGHMYNHFLLDYYLMQEPNLEKAEKIALQEIRERAVPGSYDLLAQVLFAKGDLEEARRISKTYIWEKTFEPSILMNQLSFFQGNESPYLIQVEEELKSARFELGPKAFRDLSQFTN